jgi:ubiquinol-cytochrome c reductase cytochrome c1 subunit
MGKFGLSLAAIAFAAAGAVATAPEAEAAGGGAVPPQGDYSFTGFFGSFDRGELQRGLQVYKEVCSSCHGLDLVRYRELEAFGYTEEEIKAYAAEFEVPTLDEFGEPDFRAAIPSDSFVNPYPNKLAAAAANGGKAPPDLSLIVKSRAAGLGSIGANFLDMLSGGEFATGSSYVAALVGTGYVEEPTVEDIELCQPQGAAETDEAYEERIANFEVPPGTYFNKWYPGCSIAMPSILFEDAVEYADGTPATMEQMAHDVSVFLTWASEPTMEARKQTGIMVMLFLAVFTGILIAVKRETWKDVKKH